MPKINYLSRRKFVAAAGSAVVFAALPNRFKAGAQALNPKGDVMPMNLTPYLLFDGSCAQAMEFYKSVLGGELALMKVKDSAAREHMPAFQQEKVLNAKLKSGALEISASDWLLPDRTPVHGNTVCLYLSGGTLPELKRLFEKLSEGAEVTDPLKEQFFGTYGALNDKFGVRWMFVTNQEKA